MADDLAECHDYGQLVEGVVEDEEAGGRVGGEIGFDLRDDAGCEDLWTGKEVDLALAA